MKNTELYAILVDDHFATTCSYYGNDRHIHLFNTKEEAQQMIDTYHYPNEVIVKIKKVKARV
jgi:uncharacterized protein (DUF427 family)